MRKLSCLLLTASIMTATATANASTLDDKPKVGVQKRPVDRASEDGTKSVTREIATEVIVLKGEAGAVEKTRRLIDKPVVRPEIVNVNVTIAVSETETGKGKIVDEFKLTTIDGSRAQLQFGQQVNVRSGSMQSNPAAAMMGGGRGSLRAVYSKVSVGTIVQVVPKVSQHGILLDVEVEKSWVEDSVVSGDEQSTESLPTTYSGSTASSVFVAPGQNATMQAIVSGGTSNGRLMIITFSATTGTEVANRSREIRARVSSKDTGRAEHRGSAESEKSATSSRTSRANGSDKQQAFPGKGSSRDEPGRRDFEADKFQRPERPQTSTANFGELLFQQIDKNKNRKIDNDEAKRIPPSLSQSLGGELKDLSRERFIEQADAFLQKRIDTRKGSARD